jgi:5S rRNA maturation endonuclease (ribonuclease M5)
MSNALRGTGITYFQVPNGFLTQETYKKINKTQLHLYLYLWKEAQHNTSLTVKFSGIELAENTWMADSQVLSARDGLRNLGLIMFEKVTGGYEYTLCHPDSGHAISNPRLQNKGYDFDKMIPSEVESYYQYKLDQADNRKSIKTTNGMKSCCPLCKSSRQTFEVNTKSGAFHCHACSARGKFVAFEKALAMAQGYEISQSEAHKRVVEALRACGVTDVTLATPEEEYSYSNADGEVLYEVVRFPGKKFKTRKVDKAGDYVYRSLGLPKLLYRLPWVMAANTICVVEGEKDAESLMRLKLKDSEGNDIEATTNSHGAGKWKPAHTMHLKGKRVILIGDNDSRGIAHMDDVQDALSEVAEVVRVVLPSAYKDVSEFMEKHYVQDLLKLFPQTWMEPKAII